MSCIAVVGGGISGLSTAYYLARLAPKTTQILLLEGSQRLGGWIQSHRVSSGHYTTTPPPPTTIEDNSVLFEAGPRSLRPEGTNGAILLDMVNHLNLNDHLLSVPKTDPSSKHRYIYYNGNINTLPSSLSDMLFHKPEVFKSVIMAGAFEPFQSSRFTKDGQSKDGNEDESMYHFMKRRFNEHTAVNLMGALAHGIYAGDVKQLSIQSTLRVLYEAEKNYGSVVLGMLRGDNPASMRERGMAVRARDSDPEWFGKMEKMSVLGFKQGMETLPQQLSQYLQACSNVTIVKGDPVQSIQTMGDDQVKIKTTEKEYHVQHVVSTVPSLTLDPLLNTPLPHLSHNPASNVAVVNLCYDEHVKLGYDGFGFLTPHRDTKYPIPVPGTLGVIFDSNVLSAQETTSRPKVTVMMGGSDWNDAFNVPIDGLDPQVAYDRSLQVMKQFLNMKEVPTHAMTHLQKQCIPQYGVGHESRMRELHASLAKLYGHTMSVTGASYLGVSVPDCIKHSRMLVEELLVSGALGSREKIITGLGKTQVSSQEFKDGERIRKGNTNVILQA